ncbi:MAG: hypothetical protein R3A52_03575 [Polyangiales bacterium]
MGSLALWLVDHGLAVGVASLALASLVGLWAGPAFARLARGRRAVTARGALGAGETSVPEGEDFEVTLTGVLHGEGEGPQALTATFGVRGDQTVAPPRSTQGASLSLRVENGDVALDGPVEVRCGSVEGASPPTGGLTVPEDPDGARARGVRSVASGDRVRVRGAVVPATGADARAGYRGGRRGWRMVPGAAGVIAVAYEGAPRGARSPSRERVAGAAAAFLTALVAQTALGVVGLSRAESSRGAVLNDAVGASCVGGGLGWGAASTTSLVTRRRALEAMALTLSCARDRDAAHAASLDRVLAASGVSCERRARSMEEAGAYALAARRWAGCEGDASLTHAAWLYHSLGEHGRAHQALSRVHASAIRDEPSLRRAAAIDLLAGDAEGASRWVREIAERFERGDD